jgi:translation elongation factor EF-G
VVHLESSVDKLRVNYKVNVEQGKVQVSYKETIILDGIHDHTDFYDQELLKRVLRGVMYKLLDFLVE